MLILPTVCTLLITYYVFICTDIDECVEQSPCDGNAVCTNTPGSFTSACNEEYSGDGMTCTSQNFNAEDANLNFLVLL